MVLASQYAVMQLPVFGSKMGATVCHMKHCASFVDAFPMSMC